MADLINGMLRYGISALDLSYHDYATPDELLVHGDDGKMYYKRPDGQLVTYDNNEYNKESLINAVKTASSISNTNLLLNEKDYMVYHTINISGITNILSDDSFNIPENTFTISPNEYGFFIRVRGNAATNTCMEYIEYSDMDNGTVSVTYDVIANGVSEEFTTDVVFNKLTLIPLENIGDNSEIKIKSINFTTANTTFSSYNDTIKNNLININLNKKFEADYIDIVTYVDNTDKINLMTDKVVFQNVVSIAIINTEYSGSEALVISKDKPTYKCIWGRILD